MYPLDSLPDSYSIRFRLGLSVRSVFISTKYIIRKYFEYVG